MQMVRGDWGWGGFFVSDCTALELMQELLAHAAFIFLCREGCL